MEEELSSQTAREQRIAARRSRIRERLAALKAGAVTATGERKVECRAEVGRGRQQLNDSARRLLRIKATGDLDVSAVRVVADQRESERRIREEQARQAMRGRLLAEAEASAKQNSVVAGRWADLFGIEVAQELQREIKTQQAACGTIIQSKEALISEMKAELKAKDDEYVRALKQQAEDVDVLLQYMGTQFEEMQMAYREELGEVEAAFLQERAELIAAARGEMDKLFEKRGAMEQAFLDRYLATAEDYQRQLEELRVADAEDYNVLKVRLETDLQNLEQHLEAMRATYQLNQEKLEYNFRVLTERDAENQATINQQKRRISRQRDVLSVLMARYTQHEKKFADENVRLTEEYKRITEHFKDLQAKFSHFQQADLNKLQEIWSMKSDGVQETARKLLQADRIIHEQQLGWTWCVDDQEAMFRSPHDAAAEAAAAGAEQQAATSDEEEGADEEGTEAGSAAEPASRELAEQMANPRYYGALGMLVEEAGFLVEAKAERLVGSLPPDDSGLVQAEAVVRSLGVSSGAAFDALMAALSSGRGGVPALVHPADAVKRLREFVEAEGVAPVSAAPGPGRGRARRSTALHVSRRAMEAEAEYWRRVSNVVDERLHRVYGVLEKHFAGYHKLLLERAAALQEVDSMQEANKELRQLLNQYLAASVNEDLQVPPTQLI